MSLLPGQVSCLYFKGGSRVVWHVYHPTQVVWPSQAWVTLDGRPVGSCLAQNQHLASKTSVGLVYTGWFTLEGGPWPQLICRTPTLITQPRALGTSRELGCHLGPKPFGLKKKKEGREEGRKKGRKEGRRERRKEGRREGRKEGRKEVSFPLPNTFSATCKADKKNGDAPV